MKRHAFSVCVLLSALGYCASGHCEDVLDAKVRAARREQLLALFKRDKPQSRVLQELVLVGGTAEPSARESLLSILAKRSGSSNRLHFYINVPIEIHPELVVVPYWLVDGFAAAGPAAIPDLLKSLETDAAQKSNDYFTLLATSLGRMGPEGKSAIPALRSQLANTDLPPARRTALRVILANLGEESPENQRAILADLQSTMLVRPAAQAMVLVRARNWVTQPMVDALCAHLGEPAEKGSDDVAVALGVLGERAAAAVEIVDRFIESELEKKDSGAVLHTLLLANIAPKQQERALRRLLESGPLGGCMIGGEVLMNAICNANVLVASLQATLVKFINDPNPSVSSRALAQIAMGELSIRGAVPELIRFLREKAPERRRADAACTLSSIATYSDLPNLEEALKLETSPKVTKNLGATIEYIRNLGSVTWYGPSEFDEE